MCAESGRPRYCTTDREAGGNGMGAVLNAQCTVFKITRGALPAHAGPQGVFDLVDQRQRIAAFEKHGGWLLVTGYWLLVFSRWYPYVAQIYPLENHLPTTIYQLPVTAPLRAR